MRKIVCIVSLILIILIFSTSFVSASEIDSNDTQIASNSVDYYVDLGGDDNNLGYLNSPFYSINQAISVSAHSDDVTIHLSEGIFEGENNTMLTINKAHLSRGGSITIQGQGANETFINGDYAYYIFNIRSDSVVTLKDLSIINCKSINGGAISNSGSLTILNCSFYNNRAVTCGGSIYSVDSASLFVKDTIFNNNSAKRGGAIFSKNSDIKIDSSTFTNNYVVLSDTSNPWGGAVYIGSYLRIVPSVTNSIFINNSAISNYHRDWEYASGGSIYMERCNLNNVSFINSKTEGINAQGGSYYYNPKYINTITNILRINSTVNGVLEPNIYPSNYNGEYLTNVIAYISPFGSDTDGDGSKNNPYATIKHVIEINNGKTYNLIIYLLNGTYKGEGNVNLDLPTSMNIKIIGSNSILNGENVNSFLKASTSIIGFTYELVNLTIANFKCQNTGHYKKGDNIGIIHTYVDILIENCVFVSNSGSIISNYDGSKIIINNSKFLNTEGVLLYTYDAYSVINNSLINNTNIFNRGIIELNKDSLDDCELILNNVCISNSNGDITSGVLHIKDVKCDIINSIIANNSCGRDIGANLSPINIINTTFVNSSGFSSKAKWNVVNSQFIGNKKISFNSPDSFKTTFDSILLINNTDTVTFGGDSFNIINSAIYDVIDVNTYNKKDIDLNNNYWAGLNPSQLIESHVDVLPELWIVKAISANNLHNGSFDVKIGYKLNNNQEYDATNIPINDINFILNHDSTIIEGVLTRNGFECILDVGESDLNASVYFEDNINLSIFVQNIHPTKCEITLSTNSCAIGDNLDISIDVIDLKTNKLINEGNLNLYLNDQLIAIFTLNGNKLTKTIKVNGTKSLNNISAKYFENSNFMDSNDYELFLINSIPLDTILTGKNLVKYYKNSSRYEVLLKDVLGNNVANKNIEIMINNVVYVRQTNNDGVAGLNINLSPGSYVVSARFIGDNSFNGSSTSSNITVLSTLNGNNLTKYYLNASQYYIQVLDGLGNPIKNVNITMNINGVFYKRLTNGSGVARLNINLSPGTYILTAYHPDTGLQYSNIINVLSRIETTNVGMFYKDGTGFDAKIYDEKGNILVNTDVRFNINGVFYTRTSDSNGIAHLNINLHPGRYVITTYFGDSFVGNVINIDPMPVMIISSNVIIKRGDYYQVKFYNAKGSPVISQDVAMLVNGNMNIVKTDGEGVASLKMDCEPGIYHVESGLTSFCYESKSIYADIKVLG